MRSVQDHADKTREPHSFGRGEPLMGSRTNSKNRGVLDPAGAAIPPPTAERHPKLTVPVIIGQRVSDGLRFRYLYCRHEACCSEFTFPYGTAHQEALAP